MVVSLASFHQTEPILNSRREIDKKKFIYEIWKKSDDKTEILPTRATSQVAAILATILVSNHQTKPIFKLGRKIDKIKAIVKFGRSQMTNDLDIVSTRATGQAAILVRIHQI